MKWPDLFIRPFIIEVNFALTALVHVNELAFQRILFNTPPSALKAAPLVALAIGLHK